MPRNISISITNNGAPIEGIPVMLTFLMNKKNHHGLIFGPSDSSGTIHINDDDIRREARKSMEFFLMDYADIDAHWRGTLRVAPMSREALQRALSAFRQFRQYEFPPNYEKMLTDADAVLRRIPGAKIDSKVQYKGTDPVIVETVAVRAE